MRYFTPERWLQMQDMTRPEVVHAALEEWQRAIDAYRAELKRILPNGEPHADLRNFALHVSLHDGAVLANWRARGRLRLVVRPEAPASKLAALMYELAGEPSLLAHAFPAELRTDDLEWMYDEISLLRRPSSAEHEAVFAHDILFGNGWELHVPFTRFRLSRPQEWLPVPATTPSLSFSTPSV